MFTEFIWNLDLIYHENLEIMEEFYKFVRTIYIMSPKLYNNLFGVEKIIEFVVQIFLF